MELDSFDFGAARMILAASPELGAGAGFGTLSALRDWRLIGRQIVVSGTINNPAQVSCGVGVASGNNQMRARVPANTSQRTFPFSFLIPPYTIGTITNDLDPGPANTVQTAADFILQVPRRRVDSALSPRKVLAGGYRAGQAKSLGAATSGVNGDERMIAILATVQVAPTALNPATATLSIAGPDFASTLLTGARNEALGPTNSSPMFALVPPGGSWSLTLNAQASSIEVVQMLL